MFNHNLCFEQNKKTITNFHLKSIVFTAMKYCSILQWHDIVKISQLVQNMG